MGAPLRGCTALAAMAALSGRGGPCPSRSLILVTAGLPGDGVRCTREQVWGWPRLGWGLSWMVGEGVFGHTGGQAIPSEPQGPFPSP